MQNPNSNSWPVYSLLVGALLFACTSVPSAETLGLFEGQAEVGNPGKPGGLSYDPATQAYLVSGGGKNMWSTNDDFHFVWKRVSGDVSLTAEVQHAGSDSGNAHRKACLIIRQSLSPGSPYVDATVHGDGLTSLQWREQPGEVTHEIQVATSAPRQLGIVRQGDTFFMNVGAAGQPLQNPGAYVRVKLIDPVYIGLAVCAHDDSRLEKAQFSRVVLKQKKPGPSEKPLLHCTLETISISSKDRRAIYHTTNHIEAPNWSRDGKQFIFNSGGRLWRLPVGGGDCELINTEFAGRCNNDHGFSPDGSQLAISDQSQSGKSLIYVMPATGGSPRLVTSKGPSYWHGWSPDGQTLAYCAQRDGEFDIYTIGINGGEEKRLTTAKGLDDGPDYSADGTFIYFNSERSNSMQIWRMKADGSAQEQVTSDEFNNWFPHPSPDGKWVVFLSYDKDVVGHPANKDVRLRVLRPSDGAIQELARFTGGQGTINVPSWAPDSRSVAYVTYELLYP